MASILDLARAVIAAPPPGAPGTYYYNGTSWCQTFVGNTLTKAGIQYAGSYASANAARAASTIVSTDPRKAPPGAIHWWVENHVAIATGPAKVRHVAATGRSAGATLSLGKSVYEHQTEGYPLRYAGWSYANGTRPPLTGYTDPYQAPVGANQRLTNVFTKRRTGPGRSFPDGADNFPPQTVVTPQGWINGETIDGTAAWFKIDGFYSHASTFTDRGTHDLNDLNSYAGMRVVLGTIPNGSIRVDANTAAEKVGIVTPNQQVPVTRWKKGEEVTSGDRTTSVWFEVPAPNGKGFSWAGSFTDPSTTGLTEIVPDVPPPAVDFTRKVQGTQGVNVRQYPTTSSQIVRSIPLGEEITVSKYTRGDSISSNGVTDVDIWYGVEGGVAWSGGFDSQATDGLEYIDIVPPKQQYPDTKYTFVTDFPGVVDRVVGADYSNFENEYSQPDPALRKGFPLLPAKILRHQWGEPGAYSLESVLNTFTARHLNSDDKVSPHFTIGINTITGAVEIIQNVQLGVRAYHAGVNGNDFIGIEIDPRISDTGIGLEILKAVRRLEAAIADRYNERIPGDYHRKYANTACGVYIEPWAALLDGPFEGDGDTPPVDDRSVAAIIAAIEASTATILEATPSADENGAAARRHIVAEEPPA